MTELQCKHAVEREVGERERQGKGREEFIGLGWSLLSLPSNLFIFFLKVCLVYQVNLDFQETLEDQELMEPLDCLERKGRRSVEKICLFWCKRSSLSSTTAWCVPDSCAMLKD